MSKPTLSSQNISNVFNYNDMCSQVCVQSHVPLNNLTAVLNLATNVDVSLGDFLLLNFLQSSTCFYNSKYQM